MKRLRRNPGKFEVLNLFASLGREEGFVLGDKKSEQQFLENISASLLQSKDNPALLHGFRAEDLFQFVAASLGECSLIKQEDVGEPIACTEKIQPPDYHIVLKNKSQYLIEVKNCNKKEPTCLFSLKKGYFNNLLHYAEILGVELKFAIYWSAWNQWTLISPSRFSTKDEKCSITMSTAYVDNEMILLGDYSIGTTPPLIFRILSDHNKPRTINEDGMSKFTIKEIQIICGSTVITDATEKQYALYLMFYGGWQCNEPRANISDNKLDSIDYIHEPIETAEGQGFQMIGSVSSMISKFYRDCISSSEGKVLTVNLDTGSMGVSIPKEYKGNALPLWRLHLKPQHMANKLLL